MNYVPSQQDSKAANQKGCTRCGSVIEPPTRQSIVIMIEGKMKAHNTVVHRFYSHLQEHSRLCSNCNTMYKNNKLY